MNKKKAHGTVQHSTGAQGYVEYSRFVFVRYGMLKKEITI